MIAGKGRNVVELLAEPLMQQLVHLNADVGKILSMCRYVEHSFFCFMLDVPSMFQSVCETSSDKASDRLSPISIHYPFDMHHVVNFPIFIILNSQSMFHNVCETWSDKISDKRSVIGMHTAIQVLYNGNSQVYHWKCPTNSGASVCFLDAQQNEVAQLPNIDSVGTG